MPERGARVPVPPRLRAVLDVVERFTSPLRPDDYFELISPLWSTEEHRGRIERVRAETDDAVTVFIRPGWGWRGHTPGQYLRVGFDVQGKRYWRAYSLSSAAAVGSGDITITVKRVEAGQVSPFLHARQANGSIVTLSEVEGEFTLPDPLPAKLLFLTAGSGITPVRAMLTSLSEGSAFPDVVHLHSARRPEEAIFADELGGLAEREPKYRLTQRATSTEGRLSPADLDAACPDWREREVYACGPGEMLDALSAHFKEAGLEERLHVESFEHMVAGDVVGEGGSVTFAKAGVTADCDGTTPILVAGEDAGAALPYGCRMGICHTCTGRITEGKVRDLRTGEVTQAGTEIRTCVSCAEGPVTIDL